MLLLNLFGPQPRTTASYRTYFVIVLSKPILFTKQNIHGENFVFKKCKILFVHLSKKLFLDRVLQIVDNLPLISST